jgi:hypothetical protein
MPSAKMVAQKPAGKAKPLSPLGHPCPSAASAGLKRCAACVHELPAHKAAAATMMSESVLYEVENRMKPPENRRLEKIFVQFTFGDAWTNQHPHVYFAEQILRFRLSHAEFVCARLFQLCHLILRRCDRRKRTSS